MDSFLSSVVKRQAIRQALLENHQDSNKDIAARIGCDVKTVHRVREVLVEAGEIAAVVWYSGPSRNEVLREKIRHALLENAQRTNIAVAGVVGCSRSLVQLVRAEMETNETITRFRYAKERPGVAPKARRRGGAHTSRRVLTHTRSVTSTYVYAIGPVGGGLTKIGHAWHISGRLASVQRMSPVPLTVLWHMQGGTELEARLHAVFASKRAWGEWFDLGDDPLQAIKDVL